MPLRRIFQSGVEELVDSKLWRLFLPRKDPNANKYNGNHGHQNERYPNSPKVEESPARAWNEFFDVHTEVACQESQRSQDCRNTSQGKAKFRQDLGVFVVPIEMLVDDRRLVQQHLRSGEC